jgi:hypothetical protein
MDTHEPSQDCPPAMIPHRSGKVFTLGLLGLLTGLGIILGPIAWVMGQNDLGAMRDGRMDNSGYDQTRAGRTMGIISTVLGFLISIGTIVVLKFFGSELAQFIYALF